MCAVVKMSKERKLSFPENARIHSLSASLTLCYFPTLTCMSIKLTYSLKYWHIYIARGRDIWRIHVRLHRRDNPICRRTCTEAVCSSCPGTSRRRGTGTRSLRNCASVSHRGNRFDIQNDQTRKCIAERDQFFVPIGIWIFADQVLQTMYTALRAQYLC